mmetsp:Transcript_23869/g.66694  ORF Transcript_23869/g.66694 Transcript_23869/m.66694 type:complete len:203 (-) Transcript_23869:67-675(-)
MDPAIVSEVRPNIWVGSQWSIKELEKVSSVHGRDGGNGHDARKSWTIITALGWTKSIEGCQQMVADIKAKHDGHNRKGKNSEQTDQTENAPSFIHDHIIWNIADDDAANSRIFGGEALEGVLVAIDESMERPNGACLVHCSFGISRSVSIVIAWLITRKRMSLQSALSIVQTARHGAQPKAALMTALRRLENLDIGREGEQE